MSCFISEALSRVSSPSPVRQFTSWLRSSLFKVPSSSKSGEQVQEAKKDVVRMSPKAPCTMTSALQTLWEEGVVLTEDAEGVVGLDVWGCCVTEHTEEVQEVLEAQAVSGWGCREDPADSLPEGVGLGKRAFRERHRTQPQLQAHHPVLGTGGSMSQHPHHELRAWGPL